MITEHALKNVILASGKELKETEASVTTLALLINTFIGMAIAPMNVLSHYKKKLSEQINTISATSLAPLLNTSGTMALA